jgi:DNA-binding IclR family transcriptional regulator
MGRKANQEQLQAIYQVVIENPGEKPGFIARLLGLPRSQVTRALPGLEEQGYLLSEDDRGRLWPFNRSA